MSTNNYNVSQFGENSGIDLSNRQMSAGGLRREDVASKYLSIFNKIDEDKNGIIDSSEMEKFKQEVDTNPTSFIEKKEATAYLKGEDGRKLTYQDENGRTRNLSAEDLNEFLVQYLQSVDTNGIIDTQKGVIDGKEAVIINYNDEHQDVVFNDADEPQRTITTNKETGETTTKFIKNGILIKEEIVSDRKSTRLNSSH